MDPFLVGIFALLGLGYLVLWIAMVRHKPDHSVQHALEHPDSLLLDVTEDPQAPVHPAALHIPASELRDRLTELGPTDRYVVVVAESRRASGRASRNLRAWGFRKTVDGGRHDQLPGALQPPLPTATR